MLFKLGALTKPGQAPLKASFPIDSVVSVGSGRDSGERSLFSGVRQGLERYGSPLTCFNAIWSLNSVGILCGNAG